VSSEKNGPFLVLRDVAFHRLVKFSQILKNNRGLTPRVLSFTLKDLQNDGLTRKSFRSQRPACRKLSSYQEGKRYYPNPYWFHPIWSSVPFQTRFRRRRATRTRRFCIPETNQRCWDAYCLMQEGQNRPKPVKGQNNWQTISTSRNSQRAVQRYWFD